jgi:signal transduction histidine kinase/CheY-like chemotaxis protein
MLPPNVRQIVQHCLAAPHGLARLETEIQGHTLAWALHAVASNQLVHAYAEDISERLNLEGQLRQAQKMESVGQLAAGVAHDFNNMLTVIQGHSGMLLAKSNLSPELHDSAQAIYFAAERAASLTRQLLMFSRKNVMQSTLLDVRQVVRQMIKLLQRLLGETIKLEFNPPAEMPLIQGDVGMIEQVIMNLAVNARDAMAKGGTLSISTIPVTLDEAYVQLHPQARLGNFVCLRVSDAGCGMEPAIIARIFEPFFTTKEVGKGTGLGLATVYGILKQHYGWIEVASKVGHGTTFDVFFPATTDPAQIKSEETEPAALVSGGKETILVVEDEKVLRELAHVILESSGYRVLEAGSGVEALHVWQRHQRSIDLLVTDMVMPEGVSGMDLAQKLQALNPALKIIFASGYSMDDVDTSFLRERRAVFLQKPYTHVTLAQAVRKCLDGQT